MTINHIRSFLIIITITIGLFSSCKVSKNLASLPIVSSTDTVEERENSDKSNEFEYLFVEGIKQRTLGNPDKALKIFRMDQEGRRDRRADQPL